MDLRLVSLLLLLAYACGAWSRTTRQHIGLLPRRQQSKFVMQRRFSSGVLLHRSVRSVSEFLLPPPLPSNRLQSRLQPSRQTTRRGRYARPQNTEPQASAYLGNLIHWLNPFTAGGEPSPSSSSAFPQYAPRMPYVGTHARDQQFTVSSSSAPWTNDNNCNPCDVFPWTPVIRNDINPRPGPYPGHFDSSNAHHSQLPPGPYSANLDSSSGHHPQLSPGPYTTNLDSSSGHHSQLSPGPYTANWDSSSDHHPNLSPGPTLPLHDAQPFRDGPHSYYSVDQPPPPIYHSVSSQPPPRQHIQQQVQPQIQQQIQPQIQQHVHRPPASPLSDYHGDANQHYSINIQQSPIIDIDPAIEPEHASTNLEPIALPDHVSSSFEPIALQEHASSNFEPIVLRDINNQQQQQQQDTDHAESRPPLVNSIEAADPQASATSLHFQRSPLLELSVAGESVPASNRFSSKPKAKANNASAESSALINYIVSSPRESLETRPTASTTTSTTTTTTTRRTTTTTTTTTAASVAQESRIESIVQAYEFYKSNRSRTRLNNHSDTAGRLYSNENDDVSASREHIAPSNSSDNAKKIIQIIIPYTSQYTPSPFYPTIPLSQPIVTTSTERPTRLQLDAAGDNSLEDVIPTGKSTSHNNRTVNSIDVHRLQKNIDNWTIQEYSKKASAIKSLINATYPRWISSKQIPDEYLPNEEEEVASNEYYDFSRESQLQRGTLYPIQATTTSTEPSTTTNINTEPSTNKVKVVNAVYPKSGKKPEYPSKSPSKNVYVVTPLPTLSNSIESKGRRGKVKQELDGLEQAYQVLPQAVNNLAVLANAPESVAPALWGIMEHEQIAASPNQPRWRSESDLLPEPGSTPVLYAGHSKVTYFRTKVH